MEKESTPMGELGDLLAEYLFRGKIHVKHFAEAAGLSRGYISLLKQGDYDVRPTLNTIYRLSEALQTVGAVPSALSARARLIPLAAIHAINQLEAKGFIEDGLRAVLAATVETYYAGGWDAQRMIPRIEELNDVALEDRSPATAKIAAGYKG